MQPSTLENAVQDFVDAVNRGDLEAALRHYEPEATLVVQPGVVATGHAELREALSQLLALRPTLSSAACTTLVAADMALHHMHWALAGTAPDGTAVQQEGRSADVLRRQADGSWRIVIDNPFGAEVIGPVAA